MLEQGSISLAEEENKDDLTEFSYASGGHPGFHWIAYAIRHSTVIPQRDNANYKSKQRLAKSLYTVRYGLGHNLLRKAYSAHEFMEALTAFVHDYNVETDQVYDKTSGERMPDLHTYAQKHYRQRVYLSDLDDILTLVKNYGPSLVCKMLVAYGYASVGQRGADGTKTDGDDENESGSQYTEHEQEEMNS